jgi:XRE family aerobic/anaerobic benzoate catabolism transcriptional regulator
MSGNSSLQRSVTMNSPVKFANKKAPAADLQNTPISQAEFLTSIGSRVRQFRARRGTTRKMLAAEAEVSERHLAQLESGEGNVSVVLLRRIARALNVPLSDFFVDHETSSPELHSIQQILSKLPQNQLQEIASRLQLEFSAKSFSANTPIALIGLRGAGKSTLGSKLSESLSIPLVELDHEVERQAGLPLSEIFSLYGQSGYRRIEKRALQEVLSRPIRSVINVGGGVVSERETYELLLTNCLTVWIKALPEEHTDRVIAQGDLRAMANNHEAMEDLRRILIAREPLYSKAAIHIDTSRSTIDQSFAKLRQALQEKLG